MNFLDSTGLEHFYNKIKQKFIRSVNSQTPDSDGNVTITNVAAADNLISPDAQTSYDNFIYRTSGGSASISNGEAQLIYIDGNIDIIGRVYENFSIDAENNIVIEYDSQTWRSQISLTGEYTFNYLRPSSSVATSSWAPSLGTWTYNNSTVSLSTYGLTSSNVFAPSLSIIVTGSNIRSPQVVPSTWMGIIENSGTYDFIYDGSDWTFNGAIVTLLNYGITVTGTPDENDIITVNYYSGTPNSDVVINYTAPEQGTILVATPTAFSSTGFNQFNSSSMYISNATITTGEITSNSGTYIAYCHAKGGVTNGYVAYSRNGYIRNIGWCATVPTIGASVVTTAASVSDTLASIPFDDDGYVVVVVTNLSDLCIHPKWSGVADTEYQEYAAPSTISLPTVDVEGNTIPLGSYGMPAIGQVADRLNLDAGVYIQNIGRYDYSLSNLETVQALGVDYDYDDTNIFYVLNNPVSYNVSVDQIYIVNDFGTEEFLGTSVPVKAYMLYGQNLRDKLRTDVLTISQQTPPLSQNQRQQVLSNIGISNISNPNLLDNWYFVGGGSQLGEGTFPINQGGQASYTNGWAIDRWQLPSTINMTLSLSGVTITNTNATTRYSAEQLLCSPNALRGKTVTGSILLAGGTLYAGTVSIPSAVPSSNTNISIVAVGNYAELRLENKSDGVIKMSITMTASQSVMVQAIKLELGSTQTLAHQENGTWVLNEIPNWEEEYSKCNGYSGRRNPRPNLLDNWYFVGGGSQLGNGIFPINQRRQTSYSTAAYIFDRWYMARGSVDLQAGGLRCTAPSNSSFRIEQYLPYGTIKDLIGKTCTFSALVNNTLCVFTTVVSENELQKSFNVDGAAFKLNINFVSAWGNVHRPVQLFVELSSVVVKAIKLEIGSTQTLAHQSGNTWVLNEIPDYGEQLAKCQRYLFTPVEMNAAYQVYGIGPASSDSNAVITITVPKPMARIVSFTTNIDTSKLKLNNTIPITNIDISNISGVTAKANVTCATGALTLGNCYFLTNASNTNPTFLISAE